MSCPDCNQAQIIWHWGGYRATCRGCRTRALAKGLGFWKALQDGNISRDYRAALQTLFGESWLKGHQEVKTEYARINSLKTKGQTE